MATTNINKLYALYTHPDKNNRVLAQSLIKGLPQHEILEFMQYVNRQNSKLQHTARQLISGLCKYVKLYFNKQSFSNVYSIVKNRMGIAGVEVYKIARKMVEQWLDKNGRYVDTARAQYIALGIIDKKITTEYFELPTLQHVKQGLLKQSPMLSPKAQKKIIKNNSPFFKKWVRVNNLMNMMEEVAFEVFDFD